VEPIKYVFEGSDYFSFLEAELAFGRNANEVRDRLLDPHLHD